MWSVLVVKVNFLLAVLLVSSCSTSKGPSMWDYMSPENVKCYEQVKICEQIGSRMLCECYS